MGEVGVEIVSVSERPELLPEVRRLFADYGGELDIDLSFQRFDEELATLPGAYVPPAGALLAALLSGAAVGCVGVRALDRQTAELKRLYVRPTARGTGAGHALARAAVRVATEAGYRTIRLDTLPSMAPARRLYALLGFTPIEPYAENPVSGAQFLELRLATK